MTAKALDPAITAVMQGDHGDPFAVLGPHPAKRGKGLEIRAFVPDARRVTVIDCQTGDSLCEMKNVHPEGFFTCTLKDKDLSFAYRFRVRYDNSEIDLEDAYRFPSLFGELDQYFLAEGTHIRAYEKLGAHPTVCSGVAGTMFAVWAPSARRVSVVGDFNFWDGRRHAMRKHPGCGVWEIFVPGIGVDVRYKFEIKAADGTVLPLKADPYAHYAEVRPNTASIVRGLEALTWDDRGWMTTRRDTVDRSAAVSIYEVHLGSWKRKPEDGYRPLTYRELAEDLVPYAADLGFSHIELLPIAEHPFDGSWGYQTIGMFAPTSRYGTPDDFKAFVEACHKAGIGVIMDWVPSHFPDDAHGLSWFDGTHLYEHADPRQGRHMDWDTAIYNLGRVEVANFLISNALYWLERFHVDGLRVDAVASMLYLDYSREDGAWIPNKYGGNENLEAIDFLKRLNEVVYENVPDACTVAEESTAWPLVSRPTYVGGLGFGYKWNMGWMHDTLRFMSKDPIYRKFHLNDLTFGLLYAFQENFVLPLSHDEVVHGKGSILGRMPGDRWQKFANLRAYYAFMWAHPGKKLLFMGGEFGQEREWNHNESLDWHLLDDGFHDGARTLIRDLNRAYRDVGALHELDCEPNGFEWIDCHDHEQCIVSFLRRGTDDGDVAIIVCNFTPVVREGYRIGVPRNGFYEERINSDAEKYGGGNVGNFGGVQADSFPVHGRPYSISLTLPPLSTMIFVAKGPN